MFDIAREILMVDGEDMVWLQLLLLLKTYNQRHDLLDRLYNLSSCIELSIRDLCLLMLCNGLSNTWFENQNMVKDSGRTDDHSPGVFHECWSISSMTVVHLFPYPYTHYIHGILKRSLLLFIVMLYNAMQSRAFHFR